MQKLKTTLTSKKRILVIVVLVLLAGFVISLYALDFGLARSESTATSQVDTYSAMEPEPDLSGTIYLYVEGTDPVSRALEAELKQDLLAVSAEVKVSDDLKAQFDAPVVAVFVLRKDQFYTPVYATADADVLYCFSSSGSTRYFKDFIMSELGALEPAVVFSSSDGPQLLQKGNISIQNTVQGLFSWRASVRYLAESVSREIVTNVRGLS